jgi:hypothetical protein
MANGIFTIETTGKEIKGKEVKVVAEGVADEELGEVVKFSDLFKAFEGQYVNFSIKVTAKLEDKFEAPEDEENKG